MTMPFDPTHQRRVSWQCRRGMLELDELLQTFFDHRYAGLSSNERACFERLLGLADQELSELLLRGGRCADAELTHVVEQIRRGVGR